MSFDASQSHFFAPLPPLAGGSPPPLCPICGSKQIPPESDDGLPPPEDHQYTCNATYQRPEEAPGPWEPLRPCGRVPLAAALAWIRDLCARDAPGAAAALARGGAHPPPFDPGDGAPLQLSLPPLQGEHAPETCPVCGSAAVQTSAGTRSYACGAVHWATSTRPGPGGQIPMTWGGLAPCSRPPLDRLVAVLQAAAERAGDPSIAAAAAEARGSLATGG